MTQKCYVCNRPAEERCSHCENIEFLPTATMDIFFNGFLAKSLEVCQCHVCDGVWLESSEGERIFVCSKCCHKVLRVELRDDAQLRKAS